MIRKVLRSLRVSFRHFLNVQLSLRKFQISIKESSYIHMVDYLQEKSCWDLRKSKKLRKGYLSFLATTCTTQAVAKKETKG